MELFPTLLYAPVPKSEAVHPFTLLPPSLRRIVSETMTEEIPSKAPMAADGRTDCGRRHIKDRQATARLPVDECVLTPQ